jgi:SAM-dependent methyltransferase
MAVTFRNDPSSPLTGDTRHLELVTEFPLAQLIDGYRHRLGVDVTRLFARDDGTLAFDKVQLLRDRETGVSHFHPMVFGDAAFYEALSRAPHYYPTDKQEFRLGAAEIAAGAKVLEVGAGRGHFRAHVPETVYTGLEFNPDAIAYGLARGIDLRHEDVRTLAEATPGAFDVTCSFQVIEHVEDPLGFARAMAKLTRKGGRVILSAPNADGYMSRCRDLLNAPPHHFTWWGDKAWRWLGETLHLKLVTLHHTRIDDVLLAWARMVIADGMAKMFEVELNPVVDESPMRRRIDELTEPTARMMVAGLRFRPDIPPIGHTTVAIFER